MNKLSEYISIHAHTCNQPDGIQTVDELIECGVKNNVKALAVTDHGSMAGILGFYYKAKAKNIKPIMGFEAYYVLDVDRDKFVMITENGKEKKKQIRPFHLVLLAKNIEGYHQLVRLMNIAQKHFYGKPRIDANILKKVIDEGGNNIICSTACMKSPLFEYPDHVFTLANIFKDDLYLELQYHGYAPEKEKAYNDMLIGIAKKNNFKLVITNDCHIAKKDDLILHHLMTAIDRKLLITDPAAAYMNMDGYQNITGEELWNIVSPVLDREIFDECIANVVEIVEKCNVVLPYKKGEFVFPEFIIPESIDVELRHSFKSNYDYLAYTCYNSPRYNEAIHKERLERELKTFNDCGFVDYILPLQDVMEMCLREDIETGPGRGSAAGSLINYLLNLTSLDPIKYNLSFDRFITAKYLVEEDRYINARQSAPDVDTDFEDNSLVFDYVRKKYSKDRVCGIGTQAKYKPKSAIRDTLRVHGVEPRLINFYSKFITEDIHSLSQYIDDCPTELLPIKEILPLAYRLEGRVCSASTHAAGMVFSNKLQEHIPLVIDKKGLKKGASSDYVANKDSQAGVDGENEIIEDEDAIKYVSQYDMDTIKHTGFTKYDFLGLAILKVLKMCRKLTGQTWKDLDPHDPKHEEVYRAVFAAGKTAGIFQFASGGMRHLLKTMDASNFADVQAANALFRPQTLKQELDKLYINNKFNGYEVIRDNSGEESSIVKGILSETNGVPIYQEQVLDFLTKLGKIDAYEADTFRKILSDNKTNTDPEQLKKLQNYKEAFILGAIENNLSRESAEFLYDDLASKSGYSFNRSHACCYAFIAFCLAFYKFHYPLEFIVASLNNDPDKLLDLLNDMHSKDDFSGTNVKVDIRFPSINLSQLGATVEIDPITNKKFIQLGLTMIDGLGDATCEELINNRPYDVSAININEYILQLEEEKEYKERYDAFKESLKPELQKSAAKIFKGMGNLKVKANKDLLGDLNKCASRALNSKALTLLRDAGCFSEKGAEYYPDVINQLKHYNMLLKFDIEYIKIFQNTQYHNIDFYEDVGDKKDLFIAGIILKIENKLTKTNKPFIDYQIYNPYIKKSYIVKVWSNSYEDKDVVEFRNGRKIKATLTGFMTNNFKVGDFAITRVDKKNGNFLTYKSAKPFDFILQKLAV